MKFNKRRIALAALVSTFALSGNPAKAATVTILDPTGVDYDAACWVDTRPFPPGADSVGSLAPAAARARA